MQDDSKWDGGHSCPFLMMDDGIGPLDGPGAPDDRGSLSARRYRRISTAFFWVLALCLLAACGRERTGTKSPARGDEGAPARLLVFRPGQGRLAGIGWDDASPAGLRNRAALIRRDALQAFDNPRDLNAIGALRAEAVVDLLAGDADKALAKFSRAVEQAPLQPIAWSDLAAARLQRGTAFSDPYDFVLALAAANRAFHLNPNLPAARFNRALALQRLSLYERARAEWQTYLTAERDPHWIRAAKAHSADLARNLLRPAPKTRLEAVERAVERGDRQQAQAIVAGAPQFFREHLEEALFASWAEAIAQGHEAEAERLLALARTIGQALAAGGGERMGIDTVSRIDQLRGGSPEGLATLVRALRMYGGGVALAKRLDTGALPVLQTARRLLAAQRIPLAGWATYWTAIFRYQRSEYPAALALLRPLIQNTYRDRYPALHGRALSLTGLISLVQGDPTASLTAYEPALTDFQKLGETANASRTTSMLASNLDYLGRRSDAWRRLYPALIEPATLDAPAARELICLVAAWLASEDGEPEIALWFQDELVRNALALGDSYRIVEALRGRGEILAGLGNRNAAARDLDLAKRELAKISDPPAREVMEGDLKLAEAKLAGSPAEAIELLDDVTRIFRASSYHYQLAQALYARALALDSLGRSAEAERDLATAIAEFELQRETLASSQERISYFDRTREILDAMIQVQLERLHRPAVAFNYSERARARVLLDWIVAHPASGFEKERDRGAGLATTDLAALQRQLPAGTTVVEYWALPRSLAIWVLRKDGFAVETVAVGGKTLENLIQRLNRELKRGRRAESFKISSSLYDLLIRPVARHLPPGDRIVAVPDGALHGLSFASLRDGRTGRYLIQDRICSVAPSARILIASLDRDRALAGSRDPRALAIADPDFDPQLFHDLPRLRASRMDAVFARLFPGSRMLSDRAATRRAFLEEAGGFEIVHFGGHSRVNSEYPLLSQMLFAGVPDDPARGVLYSGDVLRQRFLRTRLVALASCSTAAGKISRTEGVESLARPFLASGVPAVVASLWDVDDVTTAEFFGRFYGHLRQTFDPAEALQKTQIQSLEDSSEKVANPRTWGAFELIGGNVPER
jgi:CHAT domain-containing protein/Flp pilus assembly protein TadD